MSDWRPVLEPHCPEIQELQKGWQVLVTIEEPRRCYFLDPVKRTTSFDHPKRGPLPKPWILRVYGTSSIGYYNRDTQAFTTEDPRSEKLLEAESGKRQPMPLEGDLKTIGLSLVKAPPHLKMAAHVTKWPIKGHDLDKLQRQPIGKDKSLRDAYQIVHTLDPGANAEGGIGGMNDGVHIVKMIGVPDRLFVEKRFIGSTGMIKYAKKEIEMLRRCKHLALSCYVAGFISEGNPAEGSVYVEFCDRGSLSDVIKSYRKNKVKIPEGFIWHAFLGLCDGLAYMHGGGRFMTAHPNPPDPKWKPLVHRDMKPDNILLRGRTTHGSNKPPYCVLSDFGLTCEEGPDNATRMKCGTSLYYAPELLYTPFPAGDFNKGPEWFKFKVPQSHSADIWALGIIIYCMSKPSEFAHINLEIKDKIAKDMLHHKYYEGTASRIPHPYKLDQAFYTKELEDAINLATVVDAEKRLDGNRLIRELKALFDKAVKRKGNMVLECRLEEFAAPKHRYRADECEVRTGLKKGGGS